MRCITKLCSHQKIKVLRAMFLLKFVVVILVIDCSTQLKPFEAGLERSGGDYGYYPLPQTSTWLYPPQCLMPQLLVCMSSIPRYQKNCSQHTICDRDETEIIANRSSWSLVRNLRCCITARLLVEMVRRSPLVLTSNFAHPSKYLGQDVCRGYGV